MTDHWQARPARPEDEASLRRLFEEAFRRPMSEARWRWKLRTRPAPVDNVWLIEDQGRPVFQYGGIPRTLTLPSAQTGEPAMVAVDGMSARSHRRRGLLTAGVSQAHVAYREAGVSCVLGLPNQQWGSRTSALDWRPLFPLAWRLRPLRPEAIAARRLRLPPLARVQLLGRWWNRWADRALAPRATRPEPIVVERADQAGPDFDASAFDEAWLHQRRPTVADLDRGAGWVDWRYRRSPEHAYRLLLARCAGEAVGYLVYRLDVRDTPRGPQHFGLIAEVIANGDARRALLQQAVDDCHGEGATAIGTLAIPGSNLDDLLRRAGFRFSWGSFTVHLVPLREDLPLDRLRDPDAWSLHGGDFDVV